MPLVSGLISLFGIISNTKKMGEEILFFEKRHASVEIRLLVNSSEFRHIGSENDRAKKKTKKEVSDNGGSRPQNKNSFVFLVERRFEL